MSKNLVVVESPTKAKTISRILGPEFSVQASFGHVRDLPKSKLGVDIEHDFAPQYVIPTKSRKNVTALKETFDKSDMLWLATDEDREGEAIAWHIKTALQAPDSKVKRVAFHEITRSAVEEAFEHPRALDQNLVDAQQARRILDRLVGYILSPLLWKKLFRGLSAGRVQSAALRLIVEREREISNFKPQEYWEIELALESKKGKFAAKVFREEGKKLELKNEAEAGHIVKLVEGADQHRAASVKKDQRKRYPSPPFTTSTLQQAASTALNFSVKKTMLLAQQLYEGIDIGEGGNVGLITYMRTDSLHLATSAVEATRMFIKERFGEKYLPAKVVFYRTKTKGAQEAHEAIRPTRVDLTPERLQGKLTPDQFKLYKIIWQRMVACQMNPAILNTQEVVVKSGTVESKASGAAVSFEGFAKVFDKWPFNEGPLPEIEENELLKLLKVTPFQRFTEPPIRYTEASLVKQMEKMGIGRPSTYAPTITTLGTRGYIKRERRALVPQEVGMQVNDFLVEHFPNIVDYDFTAEMEEDLDDIAEGKKQWVPVVRDFYDPFIKQVEKKEESVEKQTPADEKTDKKCELCGKPMVVKTGRFGRFLACSGFPECRYTMPLDGNGEAVSQKTDKQCPECGAPLLRKNGRFGEFYGCSAYPKCKYIENSEKAELDMNCPKCKTGKVVSRRTKRGKVFYGCSNYPRCDFASWDKPLKEKCPTCGGIMVENTKRGWPVCKECGYEMKEIRG